MRLQDMLFEVIFASKRAIRDALAQAGFDFMSMRLLDCTHGHGAENTPRILCEWICEHTGPYLFAVSMYRVFMSLPTTSILERCETFGTWVFISKVR